jgi:hypothetical protein
MQKTQEHTTIAASVDQVIAEDAANTYLCQVLGPEYNVNNAMRVAETWRFLIQCQWPSLDRPVVAGTVTVNAQTGEVIPLSEDDVQDTRERAALRAAKERGELPLDESGYILPYLAKVRVNGYMSSDVVFFASAEGRPTWIAGDPPRWRVTTTLYLPGQGKVCELGAVDVNAQTGEVIPLTKAQTKALQRKAHDAAVRTQRLAAAAG